MSKSTAQGWQGLIALAGITLGIVPSIRAAFGAGPGLWWAWLFGDPAPTLWWLAPVAVAIVAVVAVLVLDNAARQQAR